uniref:Uncharacterized protein n=1 Tax=Wuchereria bancrofti TaxID=6293 RepID=A0AAF5PLF2_WUCBA
MNEKEQNIIKQSALSCIETKENLPNICLKNRKEKKNIETKENLPNAKNGRATLQNVESSLKAGTYKLAKNGRATLQNVESSLKAGTYKLIWEKLENMYNMKEIEKNEPIPDGLLNNRNSCQKIWEKLENMYNMKEIEKNEPIPDGLLNNRNSCQKY